MNRDNIVEWVLRLVPAVIMLQTLFYKFTGHPDSVLLFTQLGVESFGRIGLGIVELFAAILLLIPETVKYGIVLGSGLMAGAIATHVFIIGINFNNDGGALFTLAAVAMICLLVLAYRHQPEIKRLIPGFKVA
ncbi:MAG: DoxX family protein [Bacteroidota bacterium]